MRLGLLLVAGCGMATLIAGLIPWPRDWVLSFYLPLVLGGIDALAVWSVILAVVRARRREATRAAFPIPSLALAAGTTVFFLGRLPAGVSGIIVAAGVVMLTYILYRARSFLSLDRHPRW